MYLAWAYGKYRSCIKSIWPFFSEPFIDPMSDGNEGVVIMEMAGELMVAVRGIE